MRIHDCLIIGAGPIALAAARALRMRGLTVCLTGQLPRHCPNSPDLRTAALFDGSIRFLERLGAWSELEPKAARLTAIRIIDATDHLLRAPEQLFSGADIGAAQLGFNIPNPALVAALRSTLGATQDVTETAGDEINLIAQVKHVAIGDDRVTATLADGSTRAGRVALAADGHNSLTRQAAGIGVKRWDHDQAAITAHVEHALPNEAISTEIHTRSGPCTVVPLGPTTSSLVWMERPDRAVDLAQRTDDAFIAALEERLSGLLGPIRNVTPRRIFPLTSMIADRFAAQRVALIGESGHAFPPIGAQGLNLGLRDVASLADHLVDAKQSGRDIGSNRVLQTYAASRSADVWARTYGVDAFNVSLTGRVAGLLRGVALHAANASPAFKRFVLARGMQPIGAWPSMMR